MQTRVFGKTGESVSLLGYGCMRFPMRMGLIDEVKTEQQVLTAIGQGVNYFDTAYMYPGSEAVLGRILAKGHRDKVLIADKIPPYMVNSRKDMDKIFATMLDRLKTDRIDFLLVHALSDVDAWRKFRACGFDDFLTEMRAAGKVRHIGFSWHGTCDAFKQVVDDFDWDFCQIQYNYLDEQYQAGREGLRYAAAKGLGITIMEPLRGGMLVGKLPEAAKKVMAEAAVKRSPAAWAFDWLYDQPEVHVVLSGMNNDHHIAENLKLASHAQAGMFTEQDKQVMASVRDSFRSLLKVDCTGCNYCMPCPFGVDIPDCFSAWNAASLFHSPAAKIQYNLMSSGVLSGKPTHANLCTQCGKCEKRCPQHIPIRAKLTEAQKELNIAALKPVIWGVGQIFKMRGRKAKTRTENI